MALIGADLSKYNYHLPGTENDELLELELARLVHVEVLHDGLELLAADPHPHHPQDRARGLRADQSQLTIVVT